MKITKLGHSCILIEEKGVKILTDPGNYSMAQNNIKNIDIILITHQHQDHCDISSIKTILSNNPQGKIITNKSVSIILKKNEIESIVVENEQFFQEKEVPIEGFGKNHAIIYTSIPVIQNIGYLINNKMFFPGDALIKPKKSIEILALPVYAPWMRISEAIDYAIELKPKVCIPIHDGILKNQNFAYPIIIQALNEKKIKFIICEIKEKYNID